MLIIPAVDLKQGKCVCWVKDRFEESPLHSSDPVLTAKNWEKSGAGMIHIVDLDGAFANDVKQFSTIKKILENITIPIQVGGGIRDLKAIERYIESGIGRIILGSQAMYNPGLVKEASSIFLGKIVVGIDARDGMVAVEGWSKTSKTLAVDLAKEFESCGVAAIVFTDIAKDGTGSGPNIEQISALADAVTVPVIAAGGVSSLEDIGKIKKIEHKGISGIIVKKALYDGHLDLEKAIETYKI